MYNLCTADDTAIDGDNPDHITWIFEKATERAASFHIAGVTYRLTQGSWTCLLYANSLL